MDSKLRYSIGMASFFDDYSTDEGHISIKSEGVWGRGCSAGTAPPKLNGHSGLDPESPISTQKANTLGSYALSIIHNTCMGRVMAT